VAVLPSEMLNRCVGGHLPPPLDPTLRPGEYDVSFYRPPGARLGLNVHDFRGRTVVTGVDPQHWLGLAALEPSQQVSQGDVLVAINGESVLDKPYLDVVDKFTGTKHFMTLRFVSWEWSARYLNEISPSVLPAGRPPAKVKATDGMSRSSTGPQGKAVKRGRDGANSESSGTPHKRPPKKKPAHAVSEEVSESGQSAPGLA
jgi:hypothetical protein